MAKQMLYSTDAKAAMLAGVSQLAAAVKVTLGPTGRNVLLQKSFGGPKVTKDGVSVSKEIELQDPFANMGAKMANQVASKTADKAGDGTTTAVVLAEAIMKEGLKFVAAGANTVALKRGIDLGTKAAVEHIASLAKKVKGTSDLQNVATVSSNWDTQIGEIIASAFEAVGKDGVITVEEGKSLQCEKEIVEGMQFDKGYLSPYFMTNPTTLECVLDDAYVLLCEKKISSLRDIVGILEKTAATGKPLLLIAEDVDSDALAGLVVNRLRGNLKVCAVKAPAFGDRRKQILGDIATVTGGVVISEEADMKLEDVQIEHLGTARQILINKENTTLIEGGATKKAIASRVEQIRKQIETTTSDYDREKLSERLAKLAGGVAIIRAGAATETEMKERKDLIDDAVHATRAAAEEGIVAGGGVTLLACIEAVQAARTKAKGDEKIGIDILARALVGPCRQIADNSGVDGDVVVAEILASGCKKGYNAATGEYIDMVKAGIIDPAKVTRTALQNAASVAGLLLTTDLMITDYDETKEEESGIAPTTGRVL